MNSISLFELNTAIKSLFKEVFYEGVWVRAEIGEVHQNSSGHCYMELIERDVSSAIIAKQRATIWANSYRALKPYFEQETNSIMMSGMQILVYCSLEMHENYGLSLNITDIDPTYTIGQIASQKAKIIRQLEQEGIINMNKQLPFPSLPQSIAVISSNTAAGYEDFINQLQNNEGNYKFYPILFEATMQGNRTEDSVIDALDRVFEATERFDLVVIIRGGGSTSDLSAFDNYNIAAHVAQFPLPVLCGMGHLRDNSVLDIVSNTSVKTPTAAAELLISKFARQESIISDMEKRIISHARQIVTSKREKINRFSYIIPYRVREKQSNLHKKNEFLLYSLRKNVKNLINKKLSDLDFRLKTVDLLSPQTIMKRGYSIVRKNGKTVKSKTELNSGDSLQIHLHDGEMQVSVD
ncbi:MAG: exodeoxyribonuclease VII large subunit [Prevotellaceae bacterium]|jgi:exodeoxyribonuclease VII large subunit|nr:exodeoxyribonuclease VII large subunit [Prevotellaceae bacterium]